MATSNASAASGSNPRVYNEMASVYAFFADRLGFSCCAIVSQTAPTTMANASTQRKAYLIPVMARKSKLFPELATQ